MNKFANFYRYSRKPFLQKNAKIALLFKFSREKKNNFKLLSLVTKLKPTIAERQRFYISLIGNATLSVTNLNSTADKDTFLYHSTTDLQQCRSINLVQNLSNSRRFCPAFYIHRVLLRYKKCNH